MEKGARAGAGSGARAFPPSANHCRCISAHKHGDLGCPVAPGSAGTPARQSQNPGKPLHRAATDRRAQPPSWGSTGYPQPSNAPRTCNAPRNTHRVCRTPRNTHCACSTPCPAPHTTGTTPYAATPAQHPLCTNAPPVHKQTHRLCTNTPPGACSATCTHHLCCVGHTLCRGHPSASNATRTCDT